jgi:subtilisin family serine protease
VYRRVSLALVAGALVVGLTPSGAAAQEIEGQYIVVLKQQAKGDTAKRKVRDRGGKVQREFSRVLNGFSAKLGTKALAEVRKDPAVAYVEPDRVITLDATQQTPTWGLDRIDQRALPLSRTYTYDTTAPNVTAYIIDTGIRLNHAEFGGRAVSGYDAIDGGSADDCNGHGTHVAGTVGGTNHGVAKGVRLVAVRVLNCSGSGSTSGVIAGIDWVTNNRASGPVVANMSLGGGASNSLDAAIARSTTAGVTYAVAAGNESQNACNVSPARAPSAITVGATTSSDARASYSNYGSCLDIFAPGSGITSAWHTSTSATNTISGTSMASPHVAGAAALYLQANQSATPAQVATRLTGTATTGVVTNPGSGSPNRLLFTGPASTPTPPTSCAAQAYTGSLTASRQSAYPAGTSFTAAAGAHKGCLTGPASADFDLYLERWNGSSWAWVARGIGETSTETVTYTGSAGTYRWRVYSYSGTGAYRLEVTRP